jgi:hypothetical protein
MNVGTASSTFNYFGGSYGGGYTTALAFLWKLTILAGGAFVWGSGAFSTTGSG